MYSILIVDDEQIIRDGLRTIIDWEDIGFYVAGTATNGLQALEFIQENPVDVILADIKMPGMSGLELSKEIEKLYPSIRIVILSGYDNFEYARTAIRNRVFSYLLKPCREEEIEDVFSRLHKLICHEQTTINLADSAEKHLLRDELYSLIKNCSDFIELRLKNWYYAAGNAACFIFVVKLYSDTSAKIKINHFMDIVESAMPGKASAVCTQSDADTMVILASVSNTFGQDPEVFFEIINAAAETVFSTGITTGVSSPFYTYAAIKEKYIEAVKAEDHSIYSGPNTLNQFSAISDKKKIDILKLDATPIIEALISHDVESIDEIINAFFSNIIANKSFGRNEINKYIQKSCLEIESHLNSNGFPVDIDSKRYNSLKDKIKQCALIDNIKLNLTEYLNDMLADIMLFRSDLKSPLIQKAIDIINKSYCDDISLENIADRLEVTPNYFSRLFKKETSINFKDYLINIRMENAKRLLQTSQAKVYEIANMVGYNDHRYFSEAFKKLTCMSPKEFRSNSAKLNEIR